MSELRYVIVCFLFYVRISVSGRFGGVLLVFPLFKQPKIYTCVSLPS